MAFTNAEKPATAETVNGLQVDLLGSTISVKNKHLPPRIQPLPHHAGSPRRRAKTATELADGLEFLSLELRRSRP